MDNIYNTIDKSISFEIIIVDNASKDASCELIANKYPQLKLIRNSENEGFGRANNKGIISSKGDYVLLINSDVYVCENTINSTLKKIK